MAEVYYKRAEVDGVEYIYFTNENKSGYQARGTETMVANGCYVIIELYNNKFILPADSNHLFSGCTNSTFNDTDKGDASECTNMEGMFASCENLTDVSFITKLDTSNITTVAGMFCNCTGFVSIDLEDMDVSGCINFSYMFSDCSNLIEISIIGGDVSKMESLSYMFSNCRKLTTILASPNTDGSVESSVTQIFGGIFEECDMLPNYTPNYNTVHNANNMYYGDIENRGYFGVGRLYKKCDIYEKQGGQGINTKPYINNYGLGRSVEAYI